MAGDVDARRCLMKCVYILQHSYDQVFGEDDEYIVREETKLIGIYSSYKNAVTAKKEYMRKKGFNRFSEENFYIDEYELNKNYWDNGFVDWKDSTLTWSEREKKWRTMLPKEKERLSFDKEADLAQINKMELERIGHLIQNSSENGLNEILGEP